MLRMDKVSKMRNKKKEKVIVVMPAYNAAKTLKKVYDDIPKSYVDEIILVDDCSKDNTIEVAKKLGLKVIAHKVNKGYGGNQKTCYKNALKQGASIIVMLHPDYQYDPKKIPEFVSQIKSGKADIVYGSRMLVKGGAKKGGMPRYKRIGNFLLTNFLNFTLGIKMTDGATGYIAYKSKVLNGVPFDYNSNGFTFDEEMIVQCAMRGFRIAEIPIPTKYEDDSSSIDFYRSVKYGLRIFREVLKYKLNKYHLRNDPKFKMAF